MSQLRMAEKVAVCSQRIVGDDENGYSESAPCRRCRGKGYHHGFGEHRWDPDWCERCGGPGVEWHELLTPPET